MTRSSTPSQRESAIFSLQSPLLSAQMPSPTVMSSLSPVLLTVKRKPCAFTNLFDDKVINAIAARISHFLIAVTVAISANAIADGHVITIAGAVNREAQALCIH